MKATRRTRALLGAALLVASAAGCQAPTVPLLARAQVTPDFATYDVRRVALLPVRGPRDAETPRPAALRQLQDDLASFIATGTRYEVLELSEADLIELAIDDPLVDGYLSVESLLGIADRFRVEAVVHTQVLHERVHPPLSIGLHAEMASVDTGQTLWVADVQLDGSEVPVRAAIEDYYRREAGQPDGGDGWKVALISPQRFQRFAAWQLAQML
ncbi:MAG: hypothetical protein AAFZ65_06305 [Planctomycetota bacterium]